MNRHTPYLQRRNDSFNFRIAVPSDLLSIISRRELTKSLNTSDRSLAIPRSLFLAAKAKLLFQRLREMIKEKKLEEGLRVDFTFELSFDDFGKPTGIKVQAEPSEEKAVNSVIATALGSLALLPRTPMTVVEPLKKVVPTLEEIAKAFLADYPKDKEGMLKKHQACIPAFCDVVGNITISELKRIHVKEFFELLQQLPPRWADIKRAKGLSLRDIAACRHEVLLSEKTFAYTYKTSINQFLVWARENFGEDGFPEISISTLRYGGTRKAGENKQRAFKPEELKRLFEGNEMASFASDPAQLHCYWLPLLGLYTGARVNEICQLNPQCDIQQDESTGIWYLSITEEGETHERVKKSVKNPGSTRKVPVHSKLLEMGFDKYVAAVKAAGDRLIFPAWSPSKGRASGIAEKWFRSFVGQCDLRDEKVGARLVGMHALRHTFSHAAFNAGVDESYIVGHVGEGTKVARGYRGELSLRNKVEVIEKIQFDLNLPLPVSIL
jgi:integrase